MDRYTFCIRRHREGYRCILLFRIREQRIRVFNSVLRDLPMVKEIILVNIADCYGKSRSGLGGCDITASINGNDSFIAIIHIDRYRKRCDLTGFFKVSGKLRVLRSYYELYSQLGFLCVGQILPARFCPAFEYIPIFGNGRHKQRSSLFIEIGAACGGQFNLAHLRIIAGSLYLHVIQFVNVACHNNVLPSIKRQICNLACIRVDSLTDSLFTYNIVFRNLRLQIRTL